jgi:hypothetical protein
MKQKRWQSKKTNRKEEKVMRKIQSKMAAWLGLVALVYGALGVWSIAQAGQAGGGQEPKRLGLYGGANPQI